MSVDRFPMTTGRYQMTNNWSIDLGELEFRRRLEEGSLVLWRPGLSPSAYRQRSQGEDDLPAGARVREKGEQRFGYFFHETEGGQSRYSLQTSPTGPRM